MKRKADIKSIRDRQVALGYQELRYAVMRSLRFMGHLMLPVSILLTLTGFFYVSFGLIGASYKPLSWTLACIGGGAVVFAVGIAVFLIGIGIVTPYIYDSEMPHKAGKYMCMRCGYSIPSTGLLMGCKSCGAYIPIPVSSIIARLWGKSITVANIIIVGVMLLLVFL
jgi:hypothetical protein